MMPKLLTKAELVDLARESRDTVNIAFQTNAVRIMSALFSHIEAMSTVKPIVSHTCGTCGALHLPKDEADDQP